jgi:hypothetical protein
MAHRSVLLGGTASFLALFIFGLCAVRVDLIARVTRRRSNILWCWVGRSCVGVGCNTCSCIKVSGGRPQAASVANWRQLRFWWPLRAEAFNFVNHSVTWANSAAYALVLALAVSFPAGARRLRPLAAVGRMTLTPT